jgi:hypothetical protein
MKRCCKLRRHVATQLTIIEREKSFALCVMYACEAQGEMAQAYKFTNTCAAIVIIRNSPINLTISFDYPRSQPSSIALQHFSISHQSNCPYTTPVPTHPRPNKTTYGFKGGTLRVRFKQTPQRQRRRRTILATANRQHAEQAPGAIPQGQSETETATAASGSGATSGITEGPSSGFLGTFL